MARRLVLPIVLCLVLVVVVSCSLHNLDYKDNEHSLKIEKICLPKEGEVSVDQEKSTI